MKTYPTPSVMLAALQARFGHLELKAMISDEVMAHGGAILRMQAVANLWERHCHHLRALLRDLPEPGLYAGAWKAVKRAPSSARISLEWGRDSSRAEALREFRRALDRRINSRGGEQWRNHETSEEIELPRDRRDLEAILRHRVRIYSFRTKIMRARFGHLLSDWPRENY